MPVSFIPKQCDNQCLLVCIQDGSMKVRPSASHQVKTNRHLSRILSCHIFNFNRTVELRVMLPLVDKKFDLVSVNGVCNPCITVFEAMMCYYHFCRCQEARLSLSGADIERGVKKREQNETRRDYIRQNKFLNRCDIGVWVKESL